MWLLQKSTRINDKSLTLTLLQFVSIFIFCCCLFFAFVLHHSGIEIVHDIMISCRRE